MACQSLMIWRPVPDKSTFQAKVTGDDNFFDVQMDAVCSGQPPTTIPHDELTPGPAEVPINAGAHCTFDLLLNITTKPPAGTPVIVDLRIVDGDGKVVQVGDGHGGTRPAQCASQFTEATGEQPVGIVVVAVAQS